MTVYFAATVYSGTLNRASMGLILIGISFHQINEIPYISNNDFDMPSHPPQNCMRLRLQLPMRRGKGTKLLLEYIAWYYVYILGMEYRKVTWVIGIEIGKVKTYLCYQRLYPGRRRLGVVIL